MAKKTWIKIKRGLSEDPKHRAKMGIAFWLFLHLIDRADWETGIVHDWKDQDEANDMGIPLRLMRDWRQKLEAEGYIQCRQMQHGQDITIFKWVNPREYSGRVYNVPPYMGGTEQPETHVKSAPSDFEGDTQGDTQVRGKDVTPSLNPDSNSIYTKRDPHLEIIAANAPAYWGNKMTAWRAVEKVLETAIFERVDHVVIIRGIGAELAEVYQDRYAKIFEHDLLGGLNEKVTVKFEA